MPSTSGIVAAVKGHLETNLPAELTALSLPAILDFTVGFSWGPKDHLPRLGVDAESFRQERAELDDLDLNRTMLLILAGVDGPDAEATLTRCHKLGDAIRKVLTATPDQASGPSTWLQVLSCDFSPPGVYRQWPLARFVLLRVEVQYDYGYGE